MFQSEMVARKFYREKKFAKWFWARKSVLPFTTQVSLHLLGGSAVTSLIIGIN